MSDELQSVLEAALVPARRQDAQGVLDVLSTAPTEAMVHPGFWWLRGHALSWQGDWAGAAEAFEAIPELRPEDDRARALAAECHVMRLEFGRAERLLLDGLSRRPESKELLEAYCLACTHAGQTEKARALLDRLLEVDPRSEPSFWLRTQIAFIEGDRVALGEALERQLSGQPESLEKSLAMGRAMAERGEIVRAVEWFERALEQDPEGAGRDPQLRRELQLLRSPWLLPNRMVSRYGRWTTWIAGASTFAGLRIANEPAAIVFGLAFVLALVYTWTAPPLLHRWRVGSVD